MKKNSKRIARKRALPLLLVLLMLLSDFPAGAILGMIHDRNVVDLLWLAERDRSVIDSFLPRKADASEVTIDGTVNTTIAVHQKSGKHIVCVSDTDCYAFYINSDNDIEYQESTNGGATWGGTSTEIHAGAWLSLAVWYDQWTPGNSGALVHMVYFSTADDLTYAVFDTSNNTFTPNVVIASTGVQGSLTSSNEAAITRGTDGDLYVVTVDATAPTAPANFAHKCTGTCTTAGNWISAGANPWDGVGDDTDNDHSVLLLPLSDTTAHDSGDIMLVSYDIADGTVEYKVYDDSADSWSTNFTNIDNATDNTTYRNALGGSVNISTGNLYVTFVQNPGTANTSEVRAWKYNDGWSQLTDPWPDTTDGTSIVLDSNIGIDSNTNDLYVAYIRAASVAASSDVYYARSINDGSSWSTDNLLSSGTDGDHRAISVNASSDERLFAVWYDPTTGGIDVIEGNTVVDMVPAYTQAAYRWFANNNGTQIGNTLTATQDASTTLSATGDEFRLRLLVHVGGAPVSPGEENFKLQVATSTPGGCDTSFSGETYADVATGSGNVRYFNNAAPADGALLTASTSDPAHGIDSIVNQTYEESNNFTVTSTIVAGRDGKWDFSLEDFSAPGNQTYCFRVVESDGTLFGTYSVIPEIRTASAGNSAPTVSNVVLSGDSAITLNENATTSVAVTCTATDTNGFSDLNFATGTIYRSGIGAGCGANDNNCYRIASSSCSFSNCSGNSCDVTCTAPIQFFADPTDAGAFSAENWQAHVTATDDAGASGASSTSSGVELNTLLALNVTNAVNYGGLDPGDDTGGSNQTTVVTVTGNAAIDVNLSGTNMTSGGNSISVGNQLYATSTFTYSSCTVCTALTTSPSAYEIDLAKPTSTTPVTDSVFWGLSVPSGSRAGTYGGTNTFDAATD